MTTIREGLLGLGFDLHRDVTINGARYRIHEGQIKYVTDALRAGDKEEALKCCDPLPLTLPYEMDLSQIEAQITDQPERMSMSEAVHHACRRDPTLVGNIHNMRDLRDGNIELTLLNGTKRRITALRIYASDKPFGVQCLQGLTAPPGYEVSPTGRMRKLNDLPPPQELPLKGDDDDDRENHIANIFAPAIDTYRRATGWGHTCVESIGNGDFRVSACGIKGAELAAVKVYSGAKDDWMKRLAIVFKEAIDAKTPKAAPRGLVLPEATSRRHPGVL